MSSELPVAVRPPHESRRLPQVSQEGPDWEIYLQVEDRPRDDL